MTAIIFIQIMKGICSPRLQIIPMKRKPLISRREKVYAGDFVEYGITVDDDVTDVRNGGFGSTTK